jgi:hypothetical protein
MSYPDGAGSVPNCDRQKRPQRRAYSKPILCLIGDMKTLTTGGSTFNQTESFDFTDDPRP